MTEVETRAGEVATRKLEARRYHLRIEDLPAPYATESKAKPPRGAEPPPDATLNVPPGFRVQVFAEVAQARWMCNSPEGDVLVTSTRGSSIQRLRDADGDGVAESQSVFADPMNGLNLPLGMVFTDGLCFIANTDGVLRFRYTPGTGKLQGRGSIIVRLPGEGYNQHWTRNIVLDAAGTHLFVSVGSQSNVSDEPAPRASILRVALDGREWEVYASGLRNPVGLAIHPVTKELYTTVNERDLLGDDLVPDYLTKVEKGAFYGWPFAYLAPHLLDPRTMRGGVSNNPELAARTRPPEVLFEAHSAALGLAFHTAESWPARFQQGAFVAFRGSWNRSQGTGYKLVFVPFDEEGQPTGGYEDFLTGFLIDPSGPTVWGRPVGLLSRPDGSLLFSDDALGRVYRITYDPELAEEQGEAESE